MMMRLPILDFDSLSGRITRARSVGTERGSSAPQIVESVAIGSLAGVVH